jgi:hypothetical protein
MKVMMYVLVFIGHLFHLVASRWKSGINGKGNRCSFYGNLLFFSASPCFVCFQNNSENC